MASDNTSSTGDSLSSLAQGILNDVERLIGQQFGLIRRELLDELKKAAGAGLSIGTGAGATAVGSLFGALAAVHLLHKATGMPLWLSYAVTGTTLCAAGAGLMTSGVAQASEIDILPGLPGGSNRDRETGSAERRQPAAATA